MTLYGVDVSSYQAEHFPTTANGHSVSFAIVKATESTTYVNPRQTAQAAWARSKGMVVGFYHFLHPGNIQAQAEYFVEKCTSVEGDILACDWESTSDGHASGAEKDQFLKAVKKLRPDHKVLLYCNTSDWKTRDTTSYAADGLWIAEYNGKPGKPSITHPWLIHQYTSKTIDTNIAPSWGSVAEMKAWATGSKAPAPSKPAAPAKPVVDLSDLIYAAKHDPKAAQGHTTHPASVKPVEAALKAEGLLSSKYASDGSFGTTTIAAYAKWQRKCGYTGSAADGIPGSASLKKLAARHGFTVKA